MPAALASGRWLAHTFVALVDRATARTASSLSRAGSAPGRRMVAVLRAKSAIIAGAFAIALYRLAT